jgi:hypothetical protein
VVVFYGGVQSRLELWARQLAWLNTAPEHKGDGPKPPTRLKGMEKRDEAINWPPNPAPYLSEWFLEIGPTIAGSMGEAPIGWQDIAAWQTITGIELEPWEARTIRRLSQVFISQRHESEKPDCPAPYIGDRDEIAALRGNVANKVKSMFGNLKRKE